MADGSEVASSSSISSSQYIRAKLLRILRRYLSSNRCRSRHIISHITSRNIFETSSKHLRTWGRAWRELASTRLPTAIAQAKVHNNAPFA